MGVAGESDQAVGQRKGVCRDRLRLSGQNSGRNFMLEGILEVIGQDSCRILAAVSMAA